MLVWLSMRAPLSRPATMMVWMTKSTMVTGQDMQAG